MRRTLGIIGMALAVLGVLLCVGTIVGGWYGRSALNAGLRETLPAVDEVLGDGSQLLDRADLLLENANERVGGARTRLRSVVDNNAESIAAVTETVENVVTSVVEPVRYVRNELAALRSSLILFATFFNGLPSFLGLPDIPTERLQSIDERARAIDAQVESIENTVVYTQQNLAETRDNITGSLDALQENMSSLSDLAALFSDELAALQQALPAIRERVNLLATLVALLLTLFGLCGAALFANLFYDAHRLWDEGGHKWLKTHTTSTTTETTTQQAKGGESTTTTITVTESRGRRLVEDA